jgi:hypothetical protein
MEVKGKAGSVFWNVMIWTHFQGCIFSIMWGSTVYIAFLRYLISLRVFFIHGLYMYICRIPTTWPWLGASKYVTVNPLPARQHGRIHLGNQGRTCSPDDTMTLRILAGWTHSLTWNVTHGATLLLSTSFPSVGFVRNEGFSVCAKNICALYIYNKEHFDSLHPLHNQIWCLKT